MIDVFYQNLGRARSKTAEIYLNILNNDFDIVCLTETNFDRSIYNGELIDDRYFAFRRDRCDSCSLKAEGGGVFIAVRKHFDVLRQPSFDSVVEDLWLSLKVGDRTLNICLCYLPPDLPIDKVSDFHYNCQKVVLGFTPNDDFLVLGDFNTPNLTWTRTAASTFVTPTLPRDRKADLLMESISVCNMTQFNNIPKNGSRYLDLIFSNLPIVAVSIADPVSSLDKHHLAYSFNVPLHVPNKLIKSNNNTRLNFNKCEYHNVKLELTKTDWCQILNSDNVDECVILFYKTVNSIIRMHTPLYKRHSRYPKWYNGSLIHCLAEKNKYHNRFKKYKNPRDYDTFALLRTRCKILMKHCYKNWLTQIEDSIADSNNIKAFWQFINSKKGTASIPQTMNYNGNASSDGRGVCELFSDYFCSVFSPSNNSNTASLLLEFDPNSVGVLSSFTVGVRDVLHKLKALDVGKCAGPDGIPPLFFKLCADELSAPLTILFNKSIRTGMFPNIWKTAHVIPIFKSGDRSCCTNYRPISILSCPAKLFESLVYTPLYDHFKEILSDRQHGFVRRRSTLTNLLEYKDYLCGAFAVRGQVDAIYTDFSKAFDRVDHALLGSKVSQYGIHGCLLRWIKSYLSNRTQLVAVKGYLSSPKFIQSGVPQGSHLGPLFFIVFINDLICRLRSHCLVYADDLKIFKSITDANDYAAIQRDLDVLAEWSLTNGMSLNTDKCYAISFTAKKQTFDHVYTLQGVPLTRVHTIRDLGVIFDSRLTFRDHYDNIINRCNRSLGFVLRSTKHFKKPSTTLTLFYSLVRSLLEYCCPVWSPYYSVHIGRLESIQRKCLKILSYRYNYGRAHYDNQLSKFGVLSLEARRKRYDLICLHKILHSTFNSPTLLSSININTRHRPRSSHNCAFTIQVYRNNTSYYNPLVRMCRLYNNLNSKHNADIDVFNYKFTVFKKSLTPHILSL